jgi:hypothetical protein
MTTALLLPMLGQHDQNVCSARRKTTFINDDSRAHSKSIGEIHSIRLFKVTRYLTQHFVMCMRVSSRRLLTPAICILLQGHEVRVWMKNFESFIYTFDRLLVVL